MQPLANTSFCIYDSSARFSPFYIYKTHNKGGASCRKRYGGVCLLYPFHNYTCSFCLSYRGAHVVDRELAVSPFVRYAFEILHIPYRCKRGVFAVAEKKHRQVLGETGVCFNAVAPPPVRGACCASVFVVGDGVELYRRVLLRRLSSFDIFGALYFGGFRPGAECKYKSVQDYSFRLSGYHIARCGVVAAP